MRKQQGFTLIELVVVIIILGILAVVAAPKFLNLQSDARFSALQGMVASINGANSLVYSKAALQGLEKDKATAANIDLNGDGTADVQGIFGYMAATKSDLEAGLDLTFDAGDAGKATATGANGDWVIKEGTGSVEIWQAGAPSACKLTYADTTATSAPAKPTITLPAKTDC
ncbi:type II secretion system protein [Shewanella fodinae]|uniref:type II secretion system protein n=1 Tax=Shewanella fodinae TaxID=552357 RepID=UPI001676AF03|nr:type II secretion system protein [Shewanella fodinae]MCL2907372.1 type II secretion system GspH family protein [Shewanella fodinae]GGY94020.1 hypothetical protein GCM10007169_08920 [Shewanella fodinae]